MQRVLIISSSLLMWSVGAVIANPLGYSYGPPPREETEVEIQKVEVYEVPWIGDQEPQYGPPTQEYGPPSQEYGPPAQEYGPPEQVTTTDYPSITTTLPSVNSTNGNVTVDSNNSTRNQTEKLQAFTGKLSQGQYYIYHPTGLLQKVTYLTKDDSRNMAFSAQLKYENVDPVSGPIYTYDPNTYVFSRLSKR